MEGLYNSRVIPLKFAAWISAEFEPYTTKDYQSLKLDENSRISADWNVKRLLTKGNYKIHTDAIQNNLIPPGLTPRRRSFVYASEADLRNAALFGQTAAEWRKATPDKDGNMRDHATIEQLLVLASLENINALYMDKGMPQPERIDELNRLARSQMKAISKANEMGELKVPENERHA